MNPPLLSARLLRQLEQLELSAQRRSRSAGKGERRSRARGQSVEFADHRNYVAGDDLRYLDWNLYGRLERLFVKLYEEERELPVQIFLDASESMRFGTPTKFELARQVAAAIGYVALCGFDRVSVRVFPDPESPGSPAGPVVGEAAVRGGLRGIRGKRMAPTFLERMTQVSPGGTAVFNEALRRAALQVRQPGLAMVLSDLLDPAGYEDGLEALIGRGFHVHVIQVLAPEELNPATFGDLRLVDSENGAEEDVTFGKFRLKAYRRIVDLYTQKLREYCRGRGIGFYRTTSDASLEGLLLKELRMEGVLG
ncbi:MAG: DUF58 domain-containing protein [Verrucomicrobiales bacterium]|nr:DUF58 domain-containing protein [Verrucomicrobiales bacterium]